MSLRRSAFAVLFWAAASSLTLLSGPSTARADVEDFDLTAEAAKGEQLAALRAEVEVAFAALRESRERLERGQFEVTENRIEAVAGVDGKIAITSRTAFDYTKDLVRVDHTQTDPLPRPSYFTYIGNSSDSYFWDRQGMFNKMAPNYLNSDHAHPVVDPRDLGMGLYYDYVMRGKTEGTLAELQRQLTSQVNLVRIDHRDGKMWIEYFGPNSKNSRLQLVLDETRDYVPLGVEAIYKQRGTTKWKRSQFTRTTWTQVEGIWLPSQLQSELVYPKRVLSLDLKWISVNQPLDPKLFDPDALKLPKGTYICDHTLAPGRSTLVEIVGQPRGEKFLKRRGNTGRMLLVGVNVGMLLLLSVAIVVRLRWRARQNGPSSSATAAGQPLKPSGSGQESE